MIVRYTYLILFLFVAVFLSPAGVASDGCEPVREGNWQVVGASCEVGAGLWSKRPLKDEGRFWIQCGVFSRLPQAGFAEPFPENIRQNNLVFRAENGKYRCLVGPYPRFSEASGVLSAMKQSDTFSSAFIRDASVASEPIAKQEPAPQIPNTMTRRYRDIAGLKSPMPEVDEPRYADQQNVWWRATFQEATFACTADGMKLVTEQTLKAWIAKPAAKGELSSRLPYWLAGGDAFDVARGVSMPLSKTSALLVLCEP